MKFDKEYYDLLEKYQSIDEQVVRGVRDFNDSELRYIKDKGWDPKDVIRTANGLENRGQGGLNLGFINKAYDAVRNIPIGSKKEYWYDGQSEPQRTQETTYRVGDIPRLISKIPAKAKEFYNDYKNDQMSKEEMAAWNHAESSFPPDKPMYANDLYTWYNRVQQDPNAKQSYKDTWKEIYMDRMANWYPDQFKYGENPATGKNEVVLNNQPKETTSTPTSISTPNQTQKQQAPQPQQISSPKPQPPVQSQQPIQPVQSQQQNATGRSIQQIYGIPQNQQYKSPFNPQGQRYNRQAVQSQSQQSLQTPTSTQQTAQPQPPVQSQPSTSTRQTSYTSQYLPTQQAPQPQPPVQPQPSRISSSNQDTSPYKYSKNEAPRAIQYRAKYGTWPSNDMIESY